MIETLLIISTVLNCVLVWYIVQLIKRFMKFQEALDNFVIGLEEYEQHIDIIYGLEKFYGDESLANLLKHSKGILDDCAQFRNVILPIENEEDEDDEEDKYGEEA